MKALTEYDEGVEFLDDHAVEVTKANLRGDYDLADSLLDQIEDDIDYFFCMGVARGLWFAMKTLDHVDEVAP